MRIDYPPPQPHGEIRQLLSDLFYVPGTVTLVPTVKINRNMAIVRWGGDLILVNPMRLRPQQEEKLRDIGRVRHAIRLGYHHGQDDLYYRDHFDLTFWRQAGSDFYPPSADQLLREGGECPVPGGRFLEFSCSRFPEAVLWLPFNGGLLLSCDALQYWGSWRGCNWCGRCLLRFSGMRSGMQVVPAWRSRMSSRGRHPWQGLQKDFQRLLKLPFLHFLAAHGEFCADNAHEAVFTAVSRAFPELKGAA
ncbi:hypothetical protein [Microbulbifer sp. 2205BS26-8]|uniref:hypothetical protein n=1 Tax=Microbulbifer sp. 2205BS26-8 TaxID=3064386 RepID=UPI00273EA28A|nr:hypothetical protein [Microbulbifer sp. 2205BS26-8]MDP5210833.1 hypothetical protein [Microbulbifer sp. 2205BS26-8]